MLSAIGIAGMDRVTQFNILAKSGRSVETCGDVNVLILDKLERLLMVIVWRMPLFQLHQRVMKD